MVRPIPPRRHPAIEAIINIQDSTPILSTGGQELFGAKMPRSRTVSHRTAPDLVERHPRAKRGVYGLDFGARNRTIVAMNMSVITQKANSNRLMPNTYGVPTTPRNENDPRQLPGTTTEAGRRVPPFPTRYAAGSVRSKYTPRICGTHQAAPKHLLGE